MILPLCMLPMLLLPLKQASGEPINRPLTIFAGIARCSECVTIEGHEAFLW